MKLTKYLIAAIAVLTTVCSVRADDECGYCNL